MEPVLHVAPKASPSLLIAGILTVFQLTFPEMTHSSLLLDNNAWRWSGNYARKTCKIHFSIPVGYYGLVLDLFARSLPAQRRECNFGPREQMNQITAWLDGSNVYGSSDARAKSLREFVNGRLAVQNTRSTRGRDMLPANPGECSDPQRQRFCFRAGDTRVNEQVELAVVHTIWVREHNRVAAALQQLNPNWPDEVLFQEARRIVVAEMQHITYNEFLPLVLGPEFMHSFELTPKTAGHTTLYNPEIDPTITNEFAAAAYRFGHTLVQGVIK